MDLSKIKSRDSQNLRGMIRRPEVNGVRWTYIDNLTKCEEKCALVLAVHNFQNLMDSTHLIYHISTIDVLHDILN